MKAQLQGWVCATTVLLLYLCYCVHGARPIDGDENAAGSAEVRSVKHAAHVHYLGSTLL